jgi:hypothetical protein
MKRRPLGLGMIVLALLLLAGGAFVNYEALSEAYGSGPPYYSRSTNMDKWRDPLPELILADILVSLAASGLLWGGRRTLRGTGE